MTRIAMLGTGLIGSSYTQALHAGRSRDRVQLVYSRSPENAAAFAAKWGVDRWTANLDDAIGDDSTDAVIIALPNDLHERAVMAAAKAGKAVLCTKPLGRSSAEALRMLRAVEAAGVFHGYLEDLVYPPKTLKGLQSVQAGDLGRILWVRSRETHPGPHSDWFWNQQRAGGGAIIDLGCHCIEIARAFIGKDIRPVEVVCWGDTQVHPIEAEDHAIGMVRYENGAIGQFEVSWAFRGGMDLRDEVAGTEGTLWLNHWLRTGMEMYSAKDSAQCTTEKSERSGGWMFPVGDEVAALGYNTMFTDMLDAMDQGRQPSETFYDGYVVNAIVDASYRSIQSKRWETIDLPIWRGR
ncbi:1,5-anhydro-D-fructose reductase [Rubripirellula lacrimiformis]|uniref:1,5-anhydro-D-fructose reductase n=1 Tax=Rubripirellula lacrimiformis TaxID=1930273 RepID=A0A517N4D2_9BACT|nr:Gfo/Idh/MocA family oxidoreductase [Rubripirellula lacrimiformis]QDT02000.1 1,5-anhydro-D-fructose reductase [Rubripirellula lacrimiformis]